MKLIRKPVSIKALLVKNDDDPEKARRPLKVASELPAILPI
jgi:hypothetical protein